MPLGEINSKLEAIFANRIDREIFLRADKNVPYGFVVEVMSEVRKAGVDKLGMITEPPPRKQNDTPDAWQKLPRQLRQLPQNDFPLSDTSFDCCYRYSCFHPHYFAPFNFWSGIFRSAGRLRGRPTCPAAPPSLKDIMQSKQTTDAIIIKHKINSIYSSPVKNHETQKLNIEKAVSAIRQKENARPKTRKQPNPADQLCRTAKLTRKRMNISELSGQGSNKTGQCRNH